jgi:hypothetical protein
VFHLREESGRAEQSELFVAPQQDAQQPVETDEMSMCAWLTNTSLTRISLRGGSTRM